MSIYKRYEVKPLINAAGTKTRLGGARMSPEVLQAMTDAAADAVDMAELQAAASRMIAGITGAEAGYVTSGAAAGLTLGAAACITGLDPAAIDRLPDTSGMPNEIIIFRSHRNSYDHGWRAAGAKLVDVGLDDRAVGSGVRSLEPWEIEAAISDRTVAIAYVANMRNDPPLEQVVEVAHSNRLPVLVDAAGQLPPEDNLRRFTSAGADLVAFSGGKAIGGPQGTGILCGRRDLIASVLLNHLDMDIDLNMWRPPASLFPDEALQALPHHGIGRGFKVSKENIVGLLVALERFADGTWRRDVEERQGLAREIIEAVSAFRHVEPAYVEAPGFPRVSLRFHSAEDARGTYERLLAGEPGIAANPVQVREGVLILDTSTMAPSDAAIVIARLVGELAEFSKSREATT